MTTERLDIIVNEKGSRTVRRNIADIGKESVKSSAVVKRNVNDIGREVKGLNSSFSGLKTTIIGLGSVLAGRQLVGLLDTYTNIQNRLKLVTTGTKNLADVTRDLFEVSNKTRVSFQSTAELYARTALATKELGISQKETLEFVESLNKAVILSGASAQEAQAGIIQLSQGLASGALRGDELRSVLEQLPAVADVIAKGLGVTRGELRKLGEQGKITAKDVLESFREARIELDEKFSKTVPTIGQSFTVLGNSITKVVGNLDEATGITSALGKSMLFLADNMKVLVNTLIIATPLLAAFFVLMNTSLIASVTKAVVALNVAIATSGTIAGAAAVAWGALNAAMVINPFVAAATVIVSLSLALAKLVDITETAENRIERLSTEVRKHSTELRRAHIDAQAALNDDEARTKKIQELTAALNKEREALNESNEAKKRRVLIDSVLDRSGGAFSDDPAVRQELERQLKLSENFDRQTKLLNQLDGPVKNYKRDLDDLIALAFQGAIGFDELEREISKLSLVTGIQDVRDNILGGAAPDITKLKRQLDQEKAIIDNARRADLIDAEEQKALLLGVEEKFAKDKKKVQQEIADQTIAQQQKINAEEKRLQSVRLSTTANLLANLSTLILNSSEDGKKASKDRVRAAKVAGIASIAISTAQAAMESFKNLGGYPFGLIGVAGSVAAGAVQLQALNKASSGFADGGFVTGPGGPREDKINARLSNGEFVVNARSTAVNRGILEEINRDPEFVMPRRQKDTSFVRNQPFTASEGAGMGGSNVNVIVNNNASGVTANVETQETESGVDVIIFMDQVADKLAADYNNNSGPLTKVIKNSVKRGF